MIQINSPKQQEEFKIEQDQINIQSWIQENIMTQNKQFDNQRQRYFQRLGIVRDSKEILVEDNFKQIEEKKEEDLIDSDKKDFIVEKSFGNGEFQINFMVRTNEQIRHNYLYKLMSNRILKVEPSKKQQTVTIFDWDDTLLCTTYLQSLGFMNLPDNVMNQLTMLDDSASKLLEKAISCGETFIITNAINGWVEHSSKLYFQKLSNLLNTKQIVVISARSNYQEIYPGDCQKWKMETFKDIKKQLHDNIITNLICLGDSHIEMDAVHVLAKQFNQALTKTIKFKENPKPDELVKQQELVLEKFDSIYTSIKNLTIRLEKQQNTKNTERKSQTTINNQR